MDKLSSSGRQKAVFCRKNIIDFWNTKMMCIDEKLKNIRDAIRISIVFLRLKYLPQIENKNHGI